MKSDTRKTANWSTLCQHLATWEQPALLALVKDLYDSAAANRDFILARCTPGEVGDAVLESYRKQIVQQFFPPGAKQSSSWARRGRPSVAMPRPRAIPPARWSCYCG